MKFSANHWLLFLMVGIIIAVVLGQSVYFLLRTLKRARELGIAEGTLKKTISSSAVFTIAPAVSILVGVAVLARSLGLPLPWLRLSVIGSLSYETIAAESALGADNIEKVATVSDPAVYTAVLWVMTLGIAIGLILVPFVTKKIQGGMNKIGMKDKKWGEIFNNAMFLGMISAFLGYVFCDVKPAFSGNTAGLVPVLVMAVSALMMLICGLLAKKCKIRWITDYALPLSLVAGMAAAIPLTNWLS